MTRIFFYEVMLSMVGIDVRMFISDGALQILSATLSLVAGFLAHEIVHRVMPMPNVNRVHNIARDLLQSTLLIPVSLLLISTGIPINLLLLIL